ncbi:MAG: helix-turn-helix domain-containing protein [Muribaculaceae bacterium]
MRQIDENKLSQLPTFNQLLSDEFGQSGTSSRDQFDEEALTWFYGNLLRERRKELKLTQKQVAQKLGREQSYIARIERGKVDLQLTSFLRIASALGISFIPSVSASPHVM